jgi:hypothetical protein
MSPPSESPLSIEGRVVHQASNALKISFFDGPGDPTATGVQGAGDGKGKKLGILLGFKNGGVGIHHLTQADGTVLEVVSKSNAPSLFNRADGTLVATAERGATSHVTASDGSPILSLADADAEAKVPERFRLAVADRTGAALGRLDVIRQASAWSLGDDLANAIIWWDRAGRALPVPILGIRLILERPPSDLERTVLLCIGVDIALGLRPYATSMQ